MSTPHLDRLPATLPPSSKTTQPDMTDESTSHNGSTSDHIEDSDVSLERAISDIPVLRNLKFSEVPHVDILGPLLHANLVRSLDFDPSDLRSVVSSARLWEGLIQQGYRLPFLLCKVAEVRWRFGSKVTAIQAYQEANAECGDVSLERWTRAARSAVWRQTSEILDAYKTGSALTIMPGQEWRSTVINDAHFPTSVLDKGYIMIQMFKVWQERNRLGGFSRRYYNFLCMNTIALEGVCRFSQDVIYEISEIGFDRIRDINLRMVPQARYIEEGTVRDLDDAILILQDTHKALQAVLAFTQQDPEQQIISTNIICDIHRTLMRTSQVLQVKSHQGKDSVSYVNAGITRGTSRSTVVVNTQRGIIQFCPFDDVDVELEVFCSRFNALLRRDDIDPFAAAAWSHHVFITIHPFEDGNGRMARLLSSIPLIRHGLPPLSISPIDGLRPYYNQHLNQTREARNGDVSQLQWFLAEAVSRCVRTIKYFPTLYGLPDDFVGST